MRSTEGVDRPRLDVAPALARPGLPDACRLCAIPLAGPYCHACGQASRAAPRALREVLLGQTGRLVHTLRMLFTRPGELAREIDEGRDRGSMRPLTLLLNLIPLLFLLGGGANGFSVHMFAAADGSGRLNTAIERSAARRNAPLPVFEEHLEQRFRTAYSLLIVVQVTAYGLMLGLAERRRRKPWIVHFAAATHYMCFSVALSIASFSLFRAAGTTLAAHPAFWMAQMAVSGTYMGLSLHRAYDDRPLAAAAKALGVIAGGFVVALALTYLSLAVALWTA